MSFIFPPLEEYLKTNYDPFIYNFYLKNGGYTTFYPVETFTLKDNSSKIKKSENVQITQTLSQKNEKKKTYKQTKLNNVLKVNNKNHNITATVTVNKKTIHQNQIKKLNVKRYKNVNILCDHFQDKCVIGSEKRVLSKPNFITQIVNEMKLYDQNPNPDITRELHLKENQRIQDSYNKRFEKITNKLKQLHQLIDNINNEIHLLPQNNFVYSQQLFDFENQKKEIEIKINKNERKLEEIKDQQQSCRTESEIKLKNKKQIQVSGQKKPGSIILSNPSESLIKKEHYLKNNYFHSNTSSTKLSDTSFSSSKNDLGSTKVSTELSVSSSFSSLSSGLSPSLNPIIVFASQDICLKCNRPYEYIMTLACMICKQCSTLKQNIDVSSMISYGKENENSFHYKRINHLEEQLRLFQAKETTPPIPPDVLNHVIHYLYDHLGIRNVDDIEKSVIRTALRSNNKKYHKFYENDAQILFLLTGKKPPQMATFQEDRCRRRFFAIQEPFGKHCPPTRKNFFSYPWFLYKVCEMEGWDEFLPCFRLHKGIAKLIFLDSIWQKICNDLHGSDFTMNWIFIPTVNLEDLLIYFEKMKKNWSYSDVQFDHFIQNLYEQKQQSIVPLPGLNNFDQNNQITFSTNQECLEMESSFYNDINTDQIDLNGNEITSLLYCYTCLREKNKL